jgi:hypothetical protein
MSSNAFSDDKVKEILKSYNDYLHFSTAEGRYPLIVEHDLTDPRMFTIVKDSMYADSKLEGVRLIFNDPDDYKTKFPEFFQLPPVYIPTNTKRNMETGKIEGIKKDPIDIEQLEQMDANKWVVVLSEVSEVGCIWLYSLLSDTTVTFYTSDDKAKFTVIPGLKNVQAVYDRDNPTKQSYIPFNIDQSENPTQTITTKYILIAINNPSVNYTPEIIVKVTRAFGI